MTNRIEYGIDYDKYLQCPKCKESKLYCDLHNQFLALLSEGATVNKEFRDAATKIRKLMPHVISHIVEQFAKSVHGTRLNTTDPTAYGRALFQIVHCYAAEHPKIPGGLLPAHVTASIDQLAEEVTKNHGNQQ